MRYTLLQMVKDILNDLDSDDVDSIGDTIESQQVASILKSCFNEITSNRNWPNKQRLIQLEHAGDIDLPTHLQIPENLQELVTFFYEEHKEGQTKVVQKELRYKYPDDFLRYIASRNSDDTSRVRVVTDTSGTTLLVLKDRAPTYWTSFDDRYIVCDSYDESVDDTLQKQKTQAIAFMSPEWSMEDTFVPDLPADGFAGLIEEAKSTAFVVLKQEANQKAEQKAARQARWMARKAWRTHGGVRYDNYGRKGRTHGK